MNAHVFISGHVQGIGFRQFIKHHARKLSMGGWVRNLPDGRVEAVFIGDEKSLEKIIERSKKGPFLAKVEDLEIHWNKEKDPDIIGFEVLR